MSGGGEAVKQGLSTLYSNMTDQEGLFQGGDQGRMFGRFRDAQQPGGGGVFDPRRSNPYAGMDEGQIAQQQGQAAIASDPTLSGHTTTDQWVAGKVAPEQYLDPSLTGPQQGAPTNLVSAKPTRATTFHDVKSQYGEDAGKEWAFNQANEFSQQGFDPTNTESVMKMQQMMKDQGAYTGKIDGQFGPKSEAALRAIQIKGNIRSGAGQNRPITGFNIPQSGATPVNLPGSNVQTAGNGIPGVTAARNVQDLY
jgi:hypothetical protein